MFDMNNKEHLLALLSEISAEEQEWIKEREQLTSMVNEFVVSKDSNGIAECRLGIDTMNDHAHLTLADGRKMEMIFKEMFVKNNSRTSKLFLVTPIFLRPAFEDKDGNLPLEHHLGERMELRIFKDDKKLFVRINNGEKIATDMSEFPEEFEVFHVNHLGHTHPAVTALAIILAVEAIQ